MCSHWDEKQYWSKWSKAWVIHFLPIHLPPTSTSRSLLWGKQEWPLPVVGTPARSWSTYIYMSMHACVVCCELGSCLTVFIFLIKVFYVYSWEKQLFLQAYEKLKSSPTPALPFPTISSVSADSLGIYLQIAKYISYIAASRAFRFKRNSPMGYEGLVAFLSGLPMTRSYSCSVLMLLRLL